MQHAEDVDAIHERQIENHIAANGKASQILRQIVAGTTNLRILGKCLKFFIELVDERIRPRVARTSCAKVYAVLRLNDALAF